MNKFVLALLLCAAVYTQLEASAYELKSLKSPLPVISGMPVKRDNLKPGDDFHATLSETITYRGMTLPEGTQFVGYFGQPGRNNRIHETRSPEVWVSQAILPNGKTYTIYPYEQNKPNYRFRTGLFTRDKETLVNVGDKLYLEFTPATLKGLMQTGINSPETFDKQ